MARYFSIIFKNGSDMEFMQPMVMNRGMHIQVHYSSVKEVMTATGDEFVDVVYKNTARKTAQAAQEVISLRTKNKLSA